MRRDSLVTDAQVRRDRIVAKLRERGARLTPQRLAVLDALTTEDHPSIEQIYERVREDFPTTSRATIYKTVALLKEMDEVVELSFGHGGSRFNGNRPYPHPHLVCTRCGAITDLEVEALSQLQEEVSSRTGYRIVSHQVDLFGICPECQASEAHEAEG
jgi:Fur family peroxide stress response transcriptional regulator